MELIDKINRLDKYFEPSHSNHSFIEQQYDLNGWELPPMKDRTLVKEYQIDFPIHPPGGEVIGETITFTLESHKLNSFNSSLKDIRELFVKEYFVFPSLNEKIAFANAVRKVLKSKLDKFENDHEGKIYYKCFSEFITNLSDSYLEYKDPIDTPLQSFKYNKISTNHDLVKKLYNVLIDNDLITSETTFADFENILKGKRIVNKIEWIGATSELKHFINIINSPNLQFVDKGSAKWRIAEYCFIKMNTKFKNITSEDYKTYRITPKSKLRINQLIVKEVFRKDIKIFQLY